MTEEGFKRKLAAILSADVEGYSRLMGQNEEQTIRTLTSYRTTITDLVQQYRGRVVDTPGDNILAEFGSVVDAVNSAVKIQSELAERNVDLPTKQRMQFRIGVNVGDVVEEEGRIYGDGVNIAARVESMAEAGGICISGGVYDQVENKLEWQYDFLGEKKVKNISRPIRVYNLLMKSKSSSDNASEERMAFPLPDKPSIAVLPFDNMSGEPSQEYFSDGLTEQIITGISKIPSLFVIARNSTFTYKGKAVKVQQVAQEMGVRYVLEDIFSIQDDITLKLMEALQVKLIPGAKFHHYEGRTKNIKAYIKFLQGLEYFSRMTSGDNIHARKCFEEAITMDQNYSLSYAMLALAHLMDLMHNWSQSPLESFEQAEQNAVKALSLDDSLDAPLIVLSLIYLYKRQHDRAIEYGEQSLVLNPNNAFSHATFAHVLYFSGRFEEAISLLEKAFRLDPVAPFYYFHFLGHPYLMLEKYTEAIKAYKKALNLNPNFIFPHVCLAACYIGTGNDTEARRAAAEVLKIDPEFSLDKFTIASPHKDPSNTEKLVTLLRKAGLK